MLETTDGFAIAEADLRIRGPGEFLGTQGDIWDTQWDMFLALIGAVAALVTLAKAHDRGLARLAEDRSRERVPGTV